MSKVNATKTRPGAEFFLKPATAAQRQYQALRAHLVDYTETGVCLREVSHPLRQLTVRGLGHEEPTL